LLVLQDKGNSNATHVDDATARVQVLLQRGGASQPEPEVLFMAFHVLTSLLKLHVPDKAALAEGRRRRGAKSRDGEHDVSVMSTKEGQTMSQKSSSDDYSRLLGAITHR
jgi:hypothetical protein